MPLVTRILPPDAKNAKLTLQEMDNNLYYLQSLGVSGLTFSANTLTITNPTGGTKSVTINAGSTFTGGTVSGSTIFTNGLSANIISATTYQNLPTDIRVTGGTYSNGTAIFTNNTGGTFNVNGFYTGETSYVNSLSVGVGLSADTTTGDVTIINSSPDQLVILNNGTNINVTGTYPNFTIDVTGITDNDKFTTAFTYNNNTFTISDNSGSTFNSTFNIVTGLTVNGILTVTGNTNITNGLSANTLNVNGVNITGDTYVTGLTFNNSNYNLTVGRNDGVTFTDSLSILASDLTVTGGTYNSNTGVATFTNNTGGTFDVSGFITGLTDTYVTGGTYNDGTATFTNTSGGTFNVSGFYTGNTDINITGGTYSAGTITLLNNTGGTVSISGLSTGYTYTQTNNYTATIPITITHNLNTTEILIQIIDTNTNQLILGSVSNYQLNSVDVTLSSSLNGIKVVIVGGSLSSTTPRGKINLLFGHNSVSPVDSSTYYIGGQFNLAAVTTASDGRRLISPVTGYVTQVAFSRTVGGTLGTSETSTFTINNTTQSTSSTITTTATYDSSSSLINYILSSPLYVVNGDKLEIRWVTPTWVTNPTTVRQQINVLIDF